MDVITENASNDVFNEILCISNLLLNVELIKDLLRKFNLWKALLEIKGMKFNIHENEVNNVLNRRRNIKQQNIPLWYAWKESNG